MYIPERKPLFRKTRYHSNPYRIAVMLIIVMVMLLTLRNLNEGSIEPLFLPTTTPTRIMASYVEEASIHFKAGDLENAIAAYQRAIAIDPTNSDLMAELARIQVYSSTQIIIDEQRLQRLQEALETINKAEEITPEDSMIHAVKAFVLSWISAPDLGLDDREALKTQAEQEAIFALQLDSQNTLALAYYSEILVDQQKWVQADQNIRQAVLREPGLMDVRRVNAYVQEAMGNYSQAISEYKEAIRIYPNLTFLYLRMGANYRAMGQHETALEYFSQAARINEQLGVKDPIPYFSIATTYLQMGQFFPAGLNARKGLNFDPDNADAFGRLGIVFHRSRNFEGAIPALECAIRGCSAEQSCEVRQCNTEEDPMVEVHGLPLSDGTVDYYLVYGAVLAGMHRPINGFCEEAMQILAMIRRDYSASPIIMQNVVISENICRGFGYY